MLLSALIALCPHRECLLKPARPFPRRDLGGQSLQLSFPNQNDPKRFEARQQFEECDTRLTPERLDAISLDLCPRRLTTASLRK